MWFGFDPLGRCVKRWVGASGNPNTATGATFFYYDGWNLIQEGLGSTLVDRTYVHGGREDEIVASRVNGTWYHHLYDGQGNCIIQSGDNGRVQVQYDYDAFGFPYSYNSSGTKVNAQTRFLFTGREWINDLRLYDYRSRIYQPELGRFLQPDPKHFTAGDYNLYRYCHNDPVNKSDPSGLQTVRTLTSWGGGSWTNRADGLTKLDVFKLNQGKIMDAIKYFEKDMSRGTDKVTWSGRVNEIHDPGHKFGSATTVAATEWDVNPTAITNGTLKGFHNELDIKIYWNDNARAQDQLLASNMMASTGEFQHAREAFFMAANNWHRIDGSTLPSAQSVANDVACKLVGTKTPAGAAERQMKDALGPWVADSMEKSHFDHDRMGGDHIH
jgi:RHS repeat-associated protein